MLLDDFVIDFLLQDKEDQVKVVDNLKSISMASSKLLLASKSLSADPGASNIKNQLSAAARSVFVGINLFLFTSSY